MSGLDLSHLSDAQLQALAASQPKRETPYVYGPGSEFSGHPATDAQRFYAGANQQYRDPNAAAGSVANPSYDTPDIPATVGAGSIYHVTPAGGLVDPSSEPANLNLSHLTTEQLQALQANADPRMSTGEDIGRSIVTGLERGPAAIVALPGTLTNLAERGIELASGHPEVHLNLAHLGGVPDQRDVDGAVQGALGPYHTPQTAPGRYGERIAEFAPAALGGGEGLVGRGLSVLTPAIGSQAAEDVAPESMKPAAALAGALLGGGVNGVSRAVAHAPDRLMAEALHGVSDADLGAATDLQRRSAALGVHLTPFEALDQVTNGGARGGTALQHFAENSPIGRRITAPIFADRPEQMNQAVRSVAAQIAPEDVQPAASGLATQEQAENVLLRAERVRTQMANPHYTAADPQRVPAEQMEAILSDIDAEIARDHTGIVGGRLAELRRALVEREATQGRPAVAAERVPRETPNGTIYSMQGGSPEVPAQPRLPLTDIGNLDRVRKYFRDRMALPQVGADAITKEQSARIADHLSRVDQLMETVPEFATGKQVFGDATHAFVAPMQNGPLGAMANTTTLPEQVRALYPQAPPEGAAVETGTAASLLPPEVTANLTRHNLIDTWNRANTDLVGGQNQWAGARLAKALAGHDEQAAALEAGTHAVDPSGELNQRLADLLDTGRATGRRMAPGSLTHFNAEQAREFGLSPTPVRTLGGLLDPLEWGKSIDKAVGGAMYRRNVQTIANLLHATPDEAETLIAQARRRGPGESPILAALLLQGPAAGQHP